MKASQLLAISVLTAGLVTAGFLTHPDAAYAASGPKPVQHVVMFTSNGTTTQHVTTAATVGAFLEERGIVVASNDYVYPPAETPVSDSLVVEYRAAVPVTLVMHNASSSLTSSAEDVGALLEEQGITLGPNDKVQPSLAVMLKAGDVIRISRITEWTKIKNELLAIPVVHRIVFSMSPGTSKVLSSGHAGLRQTMVRYTQGEDGSIQQRVISTRVVARSSPRVVAEGVDEYDAFVRFGKRGLEKTAYITSQALQMIATAYTADCYGCSGTTATGHHAGHGIVAVDPRVIPLGTRLYIPGYGPAVAGDTGGAIHGYRIDLGFNSTSDALRFGRRTVTVYRLK